MKPDYCNTTTFTIIVALITVGIVYAVWAPALNHTPSIINTIAGNDIDVLVIIGFSGILFMGMVGLPLLSQFEVDSNPLTTEEENDTLTREVILKDSLNMAFEVCTKSLYTLPSSRWFILTDRKNNALIAWPLWGDYPKINFKFAILEADTTRIVISAASYCRGYSKKDQESRDQYPQYAYAHDTSRRLAISSLNTIRQFFKD